MITTFLSVYNHGSYVAGAIASCMCQRPAPKEIIAIDDGSDDNTFAILETIRQTSAIPITVSKMPNHKGHIHGYNLATLMARGDWVHLMAADDLMLRDDFYGRAQYLAGHDKKVAFVFGGLVLLNSRGQRTNAVRRPPFERGVYEGRDILLKMKELGNFICGGCVLLRKDIARQYPYDPAYPFTADWLLWQRILGDGYKAGCLPDPIYGYRQHDGQMTYQGAGPMEERMKCRKNLDNILSGIGASPEKSAPV